MSDETETVVVDKGRLLRDFRVERFRELKFTEREAELLADALDGRGFSVSYHTVKRTLERGCGHKLAVKIYT